ncbi:hypothetical protein [Streptosporangium vulgare]
MPEVPAGSQLLAAQAIDLSDPATNAQVHGDLEAGKAANKVPSWTAS